jgi:CelD/BcsL family acetyltransferase involved in cellulose biosynthesis
VEGSIAARGQEAGDVTSEMRRSFAELAGIADEWDALVVRAGGEIYTSFDWCKTWWEFYGAGRTLEVALVRAGGRLVAVMPFFRETHWLGMLPLRVVRVVGCDHTVTTVGIAVEGGFERTAALEWAKLSGGKWDAVIVGPLSGASERAEELARAFGEAAPGAKVENIGDLGPQTVFDLPGSFDAYLAGLSKTEKANYQKELRRLEREYRVETTVTTGEAEAAAAFERFMPLHQNMWEGKGKLGHFGDWPEGFEFHRKLIERLSAKGRAFFVELVAGGKVITSHYCFRLAGKAACFLSGREESEAHQRWSLGRIGLLDVIRYFIWEKCTLMDALRGYYEYKLRYGGRLVKIRSVRIRKSGLRAGAAWALYGLAAWVLHTAYYRVWFMRVAPRLGISGRLWKTWIRSRL